MPNISKFSWSEVFSNSGTGKTSATAVAGIGCIAVGLGGFIAGVVTCFIKCCDWGSEIIYQSLALITIGVSLLGIRKISSFNLSKDNFNLGDNKILPPVVTNQTPVDAKDPSMETSDSMETNQKLYS